MLASLFGNEPQVRHSILDGCGALRKHVCIFADGERLAMGSTTNALWLSESGGERWQLLNAHLPPIYSVRFV